MKGESPSAEIPLADPAFPPRIPVNVNNMPIIDVPLLHGLIGLSGADAHSHHIDLREERREGDSGQQPGLAPPEPPCTHRAIDEVL